MRVHYMQTAVSKDAAPEVRHSKAAGLNDTNCAFARSAMGAVSKIVCAFPVVLMLCPAYAQTSADVSPEEGSLLGVIIFFVIFVGTIVGGAAYYWWRARDKPQSADEEK